VQRVRQRVVDGVDVRIRETRKKLTEAVRAAGTCLTGLFGVGPVIAAAVLGGVGHPYGAMLGALVIGLATALDATYFSPTYQDVVAFLVLIVVLLIRPQGIFAEVASQKEVAA